MLRVRIEALVDASTMGLPYVVSRRLLLHLTLAIDITSGTRHFTMRRLLGFLQVILLRACQQFAWRSHATYLTQRSFDAIIQRFFSLGVTFLR